MAQFKRTQKVFPDGRIRERFYIDGKRVTKSVFNDKIDYSTYNSSWGNTRTKGEFDFNYFGFCC